MGDASAGATSDLKRATELARSMITEYGMSDALGPMYLGSEHEVFLGRDFAQNRVYSEKVASMVDQEMRRVLDQCYKRATDILRANMNRLHALAGKLMEKEKVDGDEFVRIMRETPELVRTAIRWADIPAECRYSPLKSSQYRDMRPRRHGKIKPACRTRIAVYADSAAYSAAWRMFHMEFSHKLDAYSAAYSRC